MRVSWPGYPHVAEIVVPRRQAGRLLTYKEQMWEVHSHLISNYTLDANYDPVQIVDIRNVAKDVRRAAFQFFSTESNTLISAPFLYNNNPKPMDIHSFKRLEPIVRELDRMFFKAIGITVLDGDYSLDNMTLRKMILQQRSLYMTYYGTFGGNRAVINTMSNLDSSKVIKLFAEFSNDGISRAGFREVCKILPRALHMLDDLLQTQKFYGKVPFHFDPGMLVHFVTNPLAAAGIRPGNNSSYKKYKDTNYIHTVSGKKVDNFAYYAERFVQFMARVLEYGMDYVESEPDFDDLFEFFCVIRVKNEAKFCYPPTAKACEELLNKCREFFIPNLMQQFLSKFLMTPRQLLERGDVIRIGQKWNHGESQRFAVYLHAFDPRMVWYTGDFKKLDKSIRDWALSLYIMSGKKYFDVSGSKFSTNFIEDLFVILCEHINVKIVNHIGDSIWTLMRSFMYSGGYETSHGDSWVVLLSFTLYIAYTCDRNPYYAEKIMQCFGSLIRIVVYGDDHVWSCPVELSAILSEDKYGKFVNEFMGMTIRDAQKLTSFFSTVGLNGELVYAGVVFLKRYFIKQILVNKKNFPIVYPFKPTHESIIKLLCNKDGNEHTYFHQAIGQAYDTLGTNPISYNMIHRFYLYWGRTLSEEPSLLFKRAFSIGDHAEMKRLMNKTNLTLEQLRRGFPSREYLLSLHEINLSLGTNKKTSTDWDEVYGVDPPLYDV